MTRGLAVVLLVALCSSAGPRKTVAHAPLPEEIAALSRRMKTEGTTAALYLERAELWRLDGNLPSAEADYRRAELMDPTLDRLNLCRAALDLDGNRPAAALGALDAYGAARPDDPQALRLRARIHGILGDWVAMAEDYARILRSTSAISPGDVLERSRAERVGGGANNPVGLARALRAIDDGIARLGPVPVLDIAAADIERRLGHFEAATSRERRIADALSSVTRSGAVEDRVTAARTARIIPDVPEKPRTGGAAAQAVIALPRYSTWKYHALGLDLGTGWSATGYDDSGWPAGPGVLGYGDTFITTTVPYGPNPAAKYPTTYFRTTFSLLDAPAAVLSLTLNVNYDDGFAAYLNGQEVARRGLAAGAGYAASAVNHEGGAWEAIDIGAGIGALVGGVNVLAVEVHQTTPGSTDLAMDAELTYAISGPASVTRGPYLQIGTPTGVTIRWRTDLPTDSRIRYGLTPGAPTATEDVATVTTEHEVRLSGLTPETRYYYSVGSSTVVLAGGDAAHTFRTFPPVGAPRSTRFWILGDSGLPGTIQTGVRDAWEAWAGGDAADVWLMLGDNAYNAGTDGEYQAGLFTPYATQLRKTILWTTRGNHDVLYSGANNDYYDIFSLPPAGEAGGVPSGTEAYYSFDYGNIHCVCLDSEGTNRAVNSPMLDWLRLDLAATSQAWTIAFWHHPPYTKGSHDSDVDTDSGGSMRDMRTNVLPILDSLGVDLVLTGHSHSYERSFLLKGHYGTSGTLTPAMIVDGGTGDPAGGGPYLKPTPGPAPREGAVYAVAGSAARADGGALNHPVMVRSLNVGGSLILDVTANNLDGRFLSQTGAVMDSFSIRKGSGSGVGDPAESGAGFRLGPARPNPSTGRVSFSLDLPSSATPVRLRILNVSGRLVREIDAGAIAPGLREVEWDGRDDAGRLVVPGIYFVRLEAGSRARAARVVMLR